jgi:hypothetical protein
MATRGVFVARGGEFSGSLWAFVLGALQKALENIERFIDEVYNQKRLPRR